ncbi:MAG: hypothetical protein GF344_17975 [Chitinivibrionales bacterium]|nr:hypothetical protein [Chitinivibrionales bacterium]MBD3358545.1 hypothetical protein [Chitinivibrionales bacterium]
MSFGKVCLRIAAATALTVFGVGCGDQQAKQAGEEETTAAANDTLNGDLFATAARNVQRAVKDANQSLQEFAESVDTADISARIDTIAENAREEMREIARKVDEEIPQEKAKARIDSIADATRRQISSLVDSARQSGNDK